MKIICITPRENANDAVFYLGDMPASAEKLLIETDFNGIYTMQDKLVEFSFKRGKPALKASPGTSLFYVCDVVYRDNNGANVAETLCGLYHTKMDRQDSLAIRNAITSINGIASRDKFREYAEKAVSISEFVAAHARFKEKFGRKKP